MPTDPELHYFCKPNCIRPVPHPVDVLPVQEFLADEAACQAMWELIASQFRTRSKFLAVWPGVRFVAVSRDPNGQADGFLLVTSPVSWQIDYVVVHPDRRGHGIASALVIAALNQAHRQGVPYVMLTGKQSLRPLYEGCGFSVVSARAAEYDPVTIDGYS